jgi:radical SAM superfamily enzyme YgiQ (UPF0313 family)
VVGASRGLISDQMRIKFILPALKEASSPGFRPIKYSLFPPLGLATLASYAREDDELWIEDEHVEALDLDDEPDIVAIEVYITSARRAYAIADGYRSRGVHVCLGGLHPTAEPEEAAAHADTVFTGPGEESWPRFLDDFRSGSPARRYGRGVPSGGGDGGADLPLPRRDLIKRRLYLVPNSLVVSRGCPHSCDFCYKDSFFRGGPSFYTARVDRALAEIESLPGRHLFFLDDDLFADRRFAAALLQGLGGMDRLWQAAGTVDDMLEPGLLEAAAGAGLRSLFVGFETLSRGNLESHHKSHNVGRDYLLAVRRARELGVMVNASFVFGMDGDDEGVFDRTADWAVAAGIETATFHILTPYPGTALHARLAAQGRILSRDWELYDTRHAVFAPARMSAARLEAGYRSAYERFYSWGSILESASAKEGLAARVRHLAYTVGWKKLEPLWDLAIKARRLGSCLPLLERVLAGFSSRRGGGSARPWARGTGQPRPGRLPGPPPRPAL